MKIYFISTPSWRPMEWDKRAIHPRLVGNLLNQCSPVLSQRNMSPTSCLSCLVLLVCFLLASVYPKDIKIDGLSKQCLSCICKGSSDCDTSKKCTHGGKACGPFRITVPFWTDAGRPTPSGDEASDVNAFKECAYDYDCSAAAVRTYMEVYAQDCNGDNRVDCVDYAYIFRLGGHGCTGKLDNLFGNRFEACLKKKKA